MKSLLQRILHHASFVEKIFRSLAWLLGFCILFITFQFYLNANQLLYHETNEAQANYVVVNKKINNSMMGNAALTVFNQTEINDLKNQPFVQAIDSIVSNQYSIMAQTGGNMAFSTQLFFEAVPDSFLDIQPKNWHWHQGDQTLPIMLSQDFLNLYNFGFALSQHLPQMSEETMQQIPFQITIYNSDKQEQFQAVIAGFTKRYSSILVPNEFMNYANQQYGQTQSPRPSRLIVQHNPSQKAELLKYLEQHQLTTNQEKNSFDNLQFMLKMVFSSLAFMGLFILTLSFIQVYQSIRIQVSKAANEINILLLLGYTPKVIQGYFIKPVIKQVVLFVIITLIITSFVQVLFAQFLQTYHLTLSLYVSWKIIVLACLLALCVYYLLRKKTYQTFHQYL
jgi:hypothetical protein